jgi:hypothetical protein
VACVYILREEIAVLLEEENLVHAEHFRKEHFVSKLMYLSDIFEKFSTMNTSIHHRSD